MNRPLRIALALLPLFAVSLLPLRPALAASSCAGFIPSTITTPALLVTAFNQAQSGNCPGADTINLAGNTITFSSAGFIDVDTAVALPTVTTPITLTNGTVTRGAATGFRFLTVGTGGALTLSNLTLTNGGGLSAVLGGAVAVGNGLLTATGATFLNNLAGNYGGAVYLSGAGRAVIADTLFQGNQSLGYGGAIAVAAGNSGGLTIARTRFFGNTASAHGGAISQEAGPVLLISNSLFAGNAAATGGAALYQTGGTAALTSLTVAGNLGSAVEIGSGAAPRFYDSIIWGNSGGSFDGTPTSLSNTAAEGQATATINTGYTAEDFFVAPLLTPNAGSTGLNFNPALYDWHLRAFSPGIDAGGSAADTPLDLDSNPRSVDDSDVPTSAGPEDMGAYERQVRSCTGYTSPYTLAGATNSMRRMNLRDAVLCANLISGDDTIDLAGQTVTFDRPFGTAASMATALPGATTPMTLRNGSIERASVGGTPNFRLLANAFNNRLTLANLTLRNGRTGSVAAGIGGGIYNLGLLTLRDSTLAGNAAQRSGALHNMAGASANIERSSFTGNTAEQDASAIFSGGQLVLSNSTVSGNSVTVTAHGAVNGSPGSQLTVVNSTIVNNTNPSATGSAGLVTDGITTLYNSILANNAPQDCSNGGGAITFSAGTSNLIEAQSASAPCGIAGTNFITADPQLGALTGSPAWYPLASANSPAVEAGDASRLNGATVDQASNTRVQGLTVDLGSHESPFLAQQRTIAFNAATSSVSEAAGLGNLVRVTTSDGAVTQTAMTVNVAVSGGTATAPDYTLTGTLTIPAGTANNALVSIASAITVVNDSTAEPNETLQLTLSAPVDGVLGTQTTTTHTINNDDVATLTIANVNQAEGNAGTSLMTFTVTLDRSVQGGLSVDYTTTGVTATAGSDFVAASGSLVFVGMVGETQTFNVTINGDTTVEANETFQVSMPSALSTVAPGALIITDTATGTLTNDDTAAVNISDASITEGNAGTVTMNFTATLSNSVQGGFTVNYATGNGTATTADADYVAATGTLTFSGSSGEQQQFSVTINGDARVEADETFTVALNTVSNAGVTITDTAIGTILNDDTAHLTIANIAQPEGNTGTRSFIFTVTLDNAVAGGFSVNYASTDGTATTADNDYVAATGTLNFSGAAGQTRTFIVTVNGDQKLEADETFTVALNTISNAAVDISDTATGTITNDDNAAVTVANVSVAEGNSGTTAMTFTATLNNAVAGGFTVNYASTDGTATTADNDYVAATGTLTFGGSAGEQQQFTVTINGDTRLEPDEILTVALNTVTNAGVDISDTAAGTITNDDSAAVTIANVSVAEGNAGTTAMTFTATLNNAVTGGFTVNYATTNGSATTADSDYVAATGTLTFSGTAGEQQQFSVTINGDTRVEADETFTVALNTVSNAAIDISDSAIGTITNDDSAAVTIANVSVAEGNTGTTAMTFTATLSNAVAGGFTVNYATTNGSATTADNDYVAATGTLTFSGTAGEQQQFSVTINGDTRVEADETFTVALNTVANAAVDISDSATGTITNDDSAAVTIANVSVTEGNTGTTAMTFTATLDNAVAGGFTVNYATANGSATTADNDYVAATGTLTFSGTAGEQQQFSVTINGDTRLEPNETFTVALNTVSNAAIAISSSATGTITNDDSAAVTLANASVTEGNTGTTAMTFTATLDNAVQGGFSVKYESANGSATLADGDYAPATGALIFTGQAGETQSFTVTVNGDLRFEPDETFTVALNTVSNPAVVAIATATGTILNDDTAPGFIVTPTSVQTTEAGGSASFTVALAAQPGASVTLPLASSDTGEGTVSPASLTFTAANWNVAQTVTVTGVDDNIVDGAIAYTIALGTSDSTDPAFDNLDPPDVSASNTDNDTAGVRVTPTALTATEGGASSSYTVVLDSEPVGGSVTVTVSADSQLSATPASLLFTAANWNSAQTVTVNAVDDALAEGNHTGSITHTVSGADYGSIAAAGVTVAITDNDTAGISITPTAGLVTTEAGGTATFTVVLTTQPSADVTIALSSSDTSEGSVSPAALTFTAANWNVTQTVTVTGADDAIVDGDVTYTIVTAAATSTDSSYAGLDANDVAVSNRDDDGASLRIADVTLAEGDTGTTAFVFSVTLTGDVAGGVRVNYATADDTALAGSDYAATSGLLTFTGTDGETQTITVPVTGDTLFEGDERFRVVLSGADPAVVVLARAEAAGTITDDDAAAQLSATKQLMQAGTSLQPAIYSLVISNSGTGPQADAAASDEFIDVLPAGLRLQNASASSGTVVAETAANTVRWNGVLAAGATVTIEIRAAVIATTAGAISNRAQVNFDSDGDGINDASALSDDPMTPGDDATVFFFTPAGVAAPTPVPLFSPWTLLALMLGIAALGARAATRKAVSFR